MKPHTRAAQQGIMPARESNDWIVLLAEDDPGDQELMRRAFDEARVGVDLMIVNDGEEALDYLLRRGEHGDAGLSPWPQVMLLDLNMPRLDGLGLLREMRRWPELKTLPVLVLSTSRSPAEIEESYALAANSYLTKPHCLEDYVTLVRALESYWFDLVVLPPVGRSSGG